MPIKQIPKRTSNDPVSSADINTLMDNIQAVYNSLSTGGGGGGGTPKDIFFTFNDERIYPGTLAEITVARPFTAYYLKTKMGVAPAGTSAEFDITKNGVSIFTTPSNRAIMAVGATFADSGTPDVQNFIEGDIMGARVIRVGTNTAGGAPLMMTVKGI